jgi:hypothetical protein
MSKILAGFTEWTEWIENLLANMVSLRVFGTDFHPDRSYPGYLPFIMKVSNRSPSLEYMAIFDGDFHYSKRVCGAWVLCDDSEFP